VITTRISYLFLSKNAEILKVKKAFIFRTNIEVSLISDLHFSSKKLKVKLLLRNNIASFRKTNIRFQIDRINDDKHFLIFNFVKLSWLFVFLYSINFFFVQVDAESEILVLESLIRKNKLLFESCNFFFLFCKQGGLFSWAPLSKLEQNCVE
jgi:hypothetical protein